MIISEQRLDEIEIEAELVVMRTLKGLTEEYMAERGLEEQHGDRTRRIIPNSTSLPNGDEASLPVGGQVFG